MASVDYQSTDPTGASNLIGQTIVDQLATVFDTADQTVFSTTTVGISPSAQSVGRVVEVTPSAGTHTFTIVATQSSATPAITANQMSIVVMVVAV